MQTAHHSSDSRTGGRYQLRHAAGVYWLLDMEPPGGSYVSPVPLNEGGAKLWRIIDSATSLEEVCARLCAEYEISTEQARSDACAFIQQLQAMHVDLGGLK